MTTTTQRPRYRAGHPTAATSEGTASAQRLLMHRGGFATTGHLPACGVGGNCYRQATCSDHYCNGHPVNNPPTKPARHCAEPLVEVDRKLRAMVWRTYLGALAVAVAAGVWWLA